MRKWIISMLPTHSVYVEPFGGMASVLMAKTRSKLEVVNDLNGDVVNLYRVLRDPILAQKLHDQLVLTPHARAEHAKACIACEDMVERARRLIIRLAMSFSASVGIKCGKTGFRSKLAGTTSQANTFAGYPQHISGFTDRLKGVTIENLPALDLLTHYDSPGTLFYVDPPYVHETRTHENAYSHEMSNEDHEEMANSLNNIKGMAIVSGYRCELYDSLYEGWHRVDKDTWADKASKRTESVWLSRPQDELPLFK